MLDTIFGAKRWPVHRLGCLKRLVQPERKGCGYYYFFNSILLGVSITGMIKRLVTRHATGRDFRCKKERGSMHQCLETNRTCRILFSLYGEVDSVVQRQSCGWKLERDMLRAYETQFHRKTWEEGCHHCNVFLFPLH